MAMGDRERSELESTAWRFLRDLYLRLLSEGTLHPGQVMPVEQQNAVLETHFHQMESDVATIMAIVAQGQGEVSALMRQRLHRAEGLDHEMVDEAIDFALADRGDG